MLFYNYRSLRPHSPDKRRGKTELPNLAFACPSCNTHKHTKTHALDPLTTENVLRHFDKCQFYNNFLKMIHLIPNELFYSLGL